MPFNRDPISSYELTDWFHAFAYIDTQDLLQYLGLSYPTFKKWSLLSHPKTLPPRWRPIFQAIIEAQIEQMAADLPRLKPATRRRRERALGELSTTYENLKDRYIFRRLVLTFKGSSTTREFRVMMPGFNGGPHG